MREFGWIQGGSSEREALVVELIVLEAGSLGRQTKKALKGTNSTNPAGHTSQGEYLNEHADNFAGCKLGTGKPTMRYQDAQILTLTRSSFFALHF